MRLDFVHSGLIVTTSDNTLSIEADDGNPGKFIVTLNWDVMGGLGYDDPDEGDAELNDNNDYEV